MLNAEIIAIGSELLTPYRVDTNSLWLTERLNSVGVDVRMKTVVGDDEARLEEAIRDALRRSEVVVSTGGLGPTEDDITKKVFARVLKRRLALNDAVLASIRARFARRNMEMPEINARQALVLEGAEVLANRNGTAPGLLLAEKDCTLVLLPGPPRELKPMFEESVLPRLAVRAGEMVIRRRTLSIFGLTESAVDELAAPIYKQYANPETTILLNQAQIELHLTARARRPEDAERLLDELATPLEGVLGNHVFSRCGEPLEQVVADLLRLNRYTVATAESCTGGLLAGRLTEVPGSSHYFREGVVAYANEAKTELLGVAAGLLEAHGAVSAEVAEAMAEGVRRRAGTTFGVGITGVAGPDGGSEAKPVGTVYIALADAAQSAARKFLFPGDRQFIRQLSVQAALDMIRRRIK
ncbi:MAG TPA: competence/damage-inducible protein A [Blastocatellia bacterium]|nr:competence/damage-inducible protein A [Blastocatellia bacterium]